jgi:hypothetical protein
MIFVGIEAKPTNMASIAEILRRAAEASTHLYDSPRYVRLEFPADITFPVARLREKFKFGPDVGKGS